MARSGGKKRKAAELLKIEGWRYFQLAGPYRKTTHKVAYPDFAATVEVMIEREIRTTWWSPSPWKKATLKSSLMNRLRSI